MGIVKVIFREGLYREEIKRDPTEGIGMIKERKKEREVFTGKELKALFPDHWYGTWKDTYNHSSIT